MHSIRGSKHHLPDPGDLITGVMLQITQHTERLALLDQREATHFRETAKPPGANLARTLAQTSDRVDASHDVAARQSALLDTLDGLDQQVGALAARLTAITAAEGNDANVEEYQPAPAPRWWKLKETKNARKPSAASEPGSSRSTVPATATSPPPSALLGPASSLPLRTRLGSWGKLPSVLYLTPERLPSALASQAEWQTRLLPALAEQLYLETTRCPHTQPATDHRPSQPVTRHST